MNGWLGAISGKKFKLVSFVFSMELYAIGGRFDKYKLGLEIRSGSFSALQCLPGCVTNDDSSSGKVGDPDREPSGGNSFPNISQNIVCRSELSINIVANI